MIDAPIAGTLRGKLDQRMSKISGPFAIAGGRADAGVETIFASVMGAVRPTRYRRLVMRRRQGFRWFPEGTPGYAHNVLQGQYRCEMRVVTRNPGYAISQLIWENF